METGDAADEKPIIENEKSRRSGSSQLTFLSIEDERAAQSSETGAAKRRKLRRISGRAPAASAICLEGRKQRQRIVLNVDLRNEIDKIEAMKAVVELEGVDSVAVDMEEKKLTVIGVVDPVLVLSALRKRWPAVMFSIEQAKKPEKEKEKEKRPGPDPFEPILIQTASVPAPMPQIPDFMSFVDLTTTSPHTDALRSKSTVGLEKENSRGLVSSHFTPWMKSAAQSSETGVAKRIKLKRVIDTVCRLSEWGTSRKQAKSFADLRTASFHTDVLRPKSTVGLLPTSACVHYSNVVGREQDKEEILQLLLSDAPMEHDVSIINIFAASGVGKTTLVHLVYNNSTVCDAFEIRGWINNTEERNMRWLLRAVIESLTKVSCSLTDQSDLQEFLEEELKGKRFLLVLDGLQNDNEDFWDSLLVPLRVAAKGSTIIVTSQNEMAMNIKGMTRSYKLKHLSDEDCWQIIRQHAFDGQDPNGQPNLITLGRGIATRCEGVPLAAKLLGIVLYAADDKTFWKAVPENSLATLKLSCDLLPHYLQPCFRYCCLFPKDYVFKKDHLVRLWMSQGFIESRGGKNVVDIGNEYFDHLVRRSFFQYSHFHDPKEEKFVMHDLVHDLAESLSENEYIRTEVDKLSSIPGKVSHVSFVPQEPEMVIRNETFKGPTDLLTFLLINKSVLKQDKTLFHFENLAILDNLFLHSRRLRTLDLSYSNLSELPDSVQNLKELRFFALNHTNIRRLPDSICSLFNLQTLELRDCNHLRELPWEISNLVNLQLLDVRNDFGFVCIPLGIGELTNLQTLSTFNVGGEKSHCSIGELMGLVNLRGDLLIGGLENVVNGDDAKDANLKTKEYLRTLTLKWSNDNCDFEDDKAARTAEQVFQSLQPHRNLQELVIRGYFGGRFPNWIGNPSFLNLISITIDNCYRCKCFPPLGQLPSLRYLSVRRMDGVELIWLGHSIVGNSFPSLETLNLWELYDWVDSYGPEDGDFPCLQRLSISRCPKLRRVPHFSSLVELSFHYCVQLPDIPSFLSLKSLKIEGLHKLESLTLPKLPVLKILEISYCEQLLSVDLVQFECLEQLKINKCPKLRFSLDEELPPMLQAVVVHGDCPLLSEWCPYGFKERSGAHQVTRRLLRQH